MAKGNRQGTITSGTGALSAGLSWAAELGLMEPVKMPSARGREAVDDIEMRGRPLTDEEFSLLVKSVGKTKSTLKIAGQAKRWRQLLRGLWLSGLRISEAMTLHESRRDCHRPLRLDDKARLLFLSSQKNRRDQSSRSRQTSPNFFAGSCQVRTVGISIHPAFVADTPHPGVLVK